MATHDYVIANGTGAAVRSDLNNALAAIVSNNSSASAPATTYAYQWWADTNDNVLKMRNSANNGWITLQQLDGTLLMEDGTEGSPGLAFRDDTDTGFFSPGANVLAISSGGNERIRFGNAEVVVNDGSDDVDFRVESDTNANMLFVNGGTNRVGVGTATPSALFHVSGPARIGANDASDAALDIGAGATGNRNAILDLVGDTTYTDYGLRIIRTDSGANASSVIEHRGTGAFGIKTREAGALTFSTNNSERIRVTSDGHVGIGVTNPGSFNAKAETLVLANGGDHVGITLDCNTDKEGSIYFADGGSGDNLQRGQIVYNHSGDSLRFVTNASEAMRVDSSGNAGIGVTAPSAKLHVAGIARIGANDTSTAQLEIGAGATGDRNAILDFIGDTTYTDYGLRVIRTPGANGSSIIEQRGTGALLLKTREAGAILFTTNNTERYRVDSAGNILIHQNSQSQPGAGNTQLGSSFTFTSGEGSSFFVSRSNNVAAHFNRAQDGTVVSFASAGNSEGSISISGSTTSFNTSSDYRLKENVVNIADGITRVKQLQPRRFNFIAHANKTVDGFLAHEAQTVVPEAVTGTHNEVDDDGNAVMQGIDQSKLVPLLTAALQEAIAKIETLEAKVAALEAG